MDVTQIFEDYVWKDGLPAGIHPTQQNGYKMIADPYRKRISIERYQNDHFIETIYDSVFLDFRHLRNADQTAWERLITEEKENEMTCLIKNQDDRVLFQEHYLYENGICRNCEIRSPQGILLSNHRMYYQHFKDPFDGVALFDANAHLVMFKRYVCNAATFEFGELIEENWHPGHNSLCASVL